MHSIRTYLLQALADPAVRGSAQFGDAALLDAAARANTNDPAAMIAAIAASVAGHAGAAEQADDITLVAAHFSGRVSANSRS